MDWVSLKIPSRRPNPARRAPVRGVDDEFSVLVRKAFLLCSRGKYAEADTLLEGILLRSPGHPEAMRLRSRIADTDHEDKRARKEFRETRRSLALDTSWRRGWAYVVLVLGALWATVDLVDSAIYAVQSGIVASKTTIITSYSRYSSYSYPWTRPAYLDLLFGAACIAICAGGILFIRRISRGVEEWEELDAPDYSSEDYSRHWW